MAFLPGKLNQCFKHVSAKTPEELERLMLEIATQAPYVIVFTPPTYNNQKWFTWYNYEYRNLQK